MKIKKAEIQGNILQLDLILFHISNARRNILDFRGKNRIGSGCY